MIEENEALESDFNPEDDNNFQSYEDLLARGDIDRTAVVVKGPDRGIYYYNGITWMKL